MDVDRSDVRVGIAIGDGQSLAARGCTTIKSALSFADQGCNQLRGLVLNNTQALSEGGGSRDVSVLHPSSRSQESTRSQLDSLGAESIFRFRMTKTDRGHRHRLVMTANLNRGFEPIGPNPAFDEPLRGGSAGSKFFCGS